MKRYLIILLSLFAVAFRSYAQPVLGKCELNGYGSEYMYSPEVNGARISVRLLNALQVRSGQPVVEVFDVGDEITVGEFKIGTVTLEDVPFILSAEATAPVVLGRTAMNLILEAYGDQITRIVDAGAYPAISTSLYDIITVLTASEPYGRNNEYAQMLYSRVKDYNRAEVRNLFEKAALSIDAERFNEGKELLDIIIPSLDEDSELWPEVNMLYALCQWNAGNEPDFLKYMNKAIARSSGEVRAQARMWMAEYYNEKESYPEEEAMLRMLIDEYCKYLGVTAEDCWKKKLSNEILAEAFFHLWEDAYKANLFPRFKIYAVYSAAWGDADSQEFCRSNGFEFESLPSFRVKDLRTVLNN